MSFLARPEPGRRISPLALRKVLSGLGSLQHCALRRDGQFLITFGESTVNPFPEKLRVKDISVQLVSAPSVTVRGTIFSPELAGCSPSALKEEICEHVATVKEPCVLPVVSSVDCLRAVRYCFTDRVCSRKSSYQSKALFAFN